MDENTAFQGNYIQNFQDAKKGKHFPGAIQAWSQDGNDFYFHGDETILQVSIVTDTIIRFRYANYGMFEEDFSYALDPAFDGKPTLVEVREDSSHMFLTTEKLVVVINRVTMGTAIRDKNNFIVLEDELGFHWEEHRSRGGNIVICTKRLQSGENFYGLGDKPCALNLRGRRLQMWGSDTYGFGADTDPIYKNIPFFLGLHHEVGYGIFLDNSFQSFFDFGKERQNVYSFWAQGGEMRYYFIYGPELQAVSEQYTLLTGTPEMPPIWALGYQQSKWSYYPEKVVRELAADFRKREIPCDVLHLDIDYMDGYRVFTWDKERFPNPKKMVADLKKDGFHTVTIIDPGVKIDSNYDVYKEGLENDFFCHRADGPLLRGSVWPGMCNFPDYTKPEVRDWWAGLFPGLMESGIAGVWNDMNEPAMFEEGTFPKDVRHDYDGHPGSHRKAHNVYGMQMSRSTNDGVKLSNPDKRPFTLTRSTFSGGQRFAAVWTGDNVASWEHLIIANTMCQRLSVSGFSFAGSDIGGFIESPSSELFIRWLQMAVFHPFYRVHSSGDHGDQEPWSFGEEALPVIRRVIEFRYRVLPYIYTAFWQYVQNGTPMLRPLHMYDQDDHETYFRMEEFLCGDHLLVCPISKPNVDGRWMYMPQGKWYNFWTDELASCEKEEVWIEAELEFIPLFVKAGAILPLYPAMQHTGEISQLEEMRLRAYYAEDTIESVVYEDAGEGYGYQKGEYNERKFTFSGSESEVRITQDGTMGFTPSYKNFKISFHGLPFSPKECQIDGQPVNIQSKNMANRFTVQAAADFKEIVLSSSVKFSPKGIS
ncbi:MAG TPA: glycosyl hydrolase [Cytophagales bacterium]|nr:glycosyl hydrolase [Cytophagales bacterium]HAA19802.1 glycosyl hydrolase [Cytophagales bacterium]HAP64230.1 glycosyl hydrolase [Cytophagales bacterium]